MKEILLVGAVHGVSVSSMFGSRHHEVEPPENFASTLGVSSGANIAVELYPGATDEPTDMDQMNDRQLDRYFLLKHDLLFRIIAKSLAATGKYRVLEVDDPCLDRAKFSAAKKIAHIEDSIKPYSWPTQSQERRLGHARTFIDLIDRVLREDAMFRNIATSEADVAIIGMAHADRLAADAALQEELGITVAEHVRIVPDEAYIREAYLSSGSVVPSHFIHPIDEEIAENGHINTVGRELATRRHNAYTVGRVLDRRTAAPDYLGMFMIGQLAADSLFELSITDKQNSDFEGTIKDVLGDASVSGSFSEGQVQFVKTYLPEVSDPAVYKTPIYYGAEATSDPTLPQYTGRYSTSSKTRGGPLFRMTPYSTNALEFLDKSSSV